MFWKEELEKLDRIKKHPLIFTWNEEDQKNFYQFVESVQKKIRWIMSDEFEDDLLCVRWLRLEKILKGSL